MSAIWGCYTTNSNTNLSKYSEIYSSHFSQYKIDSFNTVSLSKAFLGCGLQKFTKEAEFESLPTQYPDFMYTADILLDNREDLLKELSHELDSPIADGKILEELLQKEGISCCKKLRGLFAFAFLDLNSKKLYLSTDPLGERSLYYKIEEETIHFSTTFESILLVSPSSINKNWVGDFLGMDHLIMHTDAVQTPYEGIYRIEPAHYIEIDLTTLHYTKHKYWDPLSSTSLLHFHSDSQYRDHFRNLFFDCVKCTLRSYQETGIMLSAGFDSTAVGAVASLELEKQNQSLYSFTSIPLDGYVETQNNSSLENEKEDVLKTIESYRNIIPTFIQIPEQNIWNMHETVLKDIGMPFKSIQNYLWKKESFIKASELGCKIILTGSFGNSTISYTDFEVYIQDLFERGHIIKALRELSHFQTAYQFKYSTAFKEIIKKAVHKDTLLDEILKNPFEKSFIRTSFLTEVHSDERILEMNQKFSLSNHTHSESRKIMLQDIAKRQSGEIDTKLSLLTGVLQRDPTRDKRLVEFCLNLPPEQFCKNGTDRRLVREYLNDIIPEHILNSTKKGRQSADLKFRLKDSWTNIKEEWENIYINNKENPIINCGKALNDLLYHNELNNFQLTRHVYTVTMLKFLNSHTDILLFKKSESHIQAPIIEPLISVIVPIFNSEEYLDECLNSLQKQSYKNLEILLIDDGSTDSSKSICLSYAEVDQRFHYFYKENGGVSSARNLGLENANGEFIGFTDSDDWVETDYIKILYETLVNNNSDLSVCTYNRIEKNETLPGNSDGNIHIFYEYEMLQEYYNLKNRINISSAVWNKLFRKELIGENRFPLIDMSEDSSLLVILLGACTKACYINCPLYNYRDRENSLTHVKMSHKKMSEYIAFSKIQWDVLKKTNNIRIYYFISYTFFCILLNTFCHVSRFSDKKLYYLIKKELTHCKKIARIYLPYVDRSHMSRYDYGLVYISTFSPLFYSLLNTLLQRAHKIKKRIIRK